MASDSLTVDRDQTVLIVAPAGGVAQRSIAILDRHGLRAEICGGIADLCAGIRDGAGAGLVSEAALSGAHASALSLLVETLAAQPAWSDFPLILLARRGRATAAHQQILLAFEDIGHASVLERPVRATTLVSAVQVALRARRRQYDLRDHLREHDRQQKALRDLNETLEQRAAERSAVAERRTAQLRALASELTQAEQRERRRLAELLHDHLQQLLVAAKLSIGAVRRRMKGEADERLEQVAALLDESIDASRSLAVELCPPILYDAGLASALEWLGRHMQDKHGLNVTVEADAVAEPEAEDIRIFAFQAVRELLFNVVKHAPGAWARVTMSADGEDVLEICVEDDGPGIAPDVFEREHPLEGGFGLLNIRERIELIGGRLELRGDRDRGACFMLVLPRFEDGAASRDAAQADAPAALRCHNGDADAVPCGSNGHCIRVLLADDHAIVRQGLAGLLEDQCDIEVVGQASDGIAAVEETFRLRPDVVVMDVSMPRMSGIEATRRITRELPQVRVIGLSLHEEEDIAKALREAGAVAYLSKGGLSEELCRAIRTARAPRDAEPQRVIP